MYSTVTVEVPFDVETCILISSYGHSLFIFNQFCKLIVQLFPNIRIKRFHFFGNCCCCCYFFESFQFRAGSEETALHIHVAEYCHMQRVQHTITIPLALFLALPQMVELFDVLPVKALSYPFCFLLQRVYVLNGTSKILFRNYRNSEQLGIRCRLLRAVVGFCEMVQTVFGCCMEINLNYSQLVTTKIVVIRNGSYGFCFVECVKICSPAVAQLHV